MTELEKKAEKFQKEFDELKEQVKGNEGLKKAIDSLEEKFKDFDPKEIKQFNPKENEEFKSLDTALNDLKKQVDGMKKKEDEGMSVKDAVYEIISKPEFKEAFDRGEFKTQVGKTYELKTDTSDFIGDVTRSQVKPGANYPREQMLSVIPLFTTIPMEQDRNRIVWIEGSYTSNVGYVGEGAAIGADDTGAEEEKSREIAKISAKMPFTAEMFEDRSAFASRLQNKLQFNSQKFVNTNLINGDGNDATQKKHIYGLKTQGSTAYSTPTDLVGAYKFANIDDLATAIGVQADVYTPNYVFMNKLTIAKYSRQKDTTGQLVIREVNGQKILGGMTVVDSYAMDNDEMLAVDSNTLELWVKRNLEFKVGQEQDDLSTDKYTAVAFWRGQALVEGPDKAGNIYVADINAALIALDPDRT